MAYLFRIVVHIRSCFLYYFILLFQILWTQALSELLDILRDRFYFLHELDLIFEKHNHRLCDLKKTTTKMFDKISIEHERILEVKTIKLYFEFFHKFTWLFNKI